MREDIGDVIFESSLSSSLPFSWLPSELKNKYRSGKECSFVSLQKEIVYEWIFKRVWRSTERWMKKYRKENERKGKSSRVLKGNQRLKDLKRVDRENVCVLIWRRRFV